MRYPAFVLDHIKNPRNVGEIENTSAKARVRSSADGDMLQLHLLIDDDVIRDAKFKVFGCGAAIATGSLLTEMLIGMKVSEALLITNEQLSEMMGGLPPEKIHCSVLAEQAIHEALSTLK
ncbi:MAG TPA: iron-sulfur cluster assembly scaffold protein [Acidobacteriota bacterium]|nr:iron-sulfur cluster assembly scaffold protein [Acidobacteriota bacterium]